MLVLSRKEGEKIVLPDCEVTITVVKIAGNKTRLGISAPPGVVVHREEVWKRLGLLTGDSPNRHQPFIKGLYHATEKKNSRTNGGPERKETNHEEQLL